MPRQVRLEDRRTVYKKPATGLLIRNKRGLAEDFIRVVHECISEKEDSGSSFVGSAKESSAVNPKTIALVIGKITTRKRVDLVYLKDLAHELARTENRGSHDEEKENRIFAEALAGKEKELEQMLKRHGN